MSFDVNNEVYQKLLECKWFENCGTEVNVEYSFPVKLIDDIKVANEGAEKTSWANFCLECREDDRIKIYKLCESAKNTWNSVGENVHKNYIGKIEKEIAEACEKRNLSKKVYTIAKHHIMMVLIFSSYEEIYKSELYFNFLEIYLSGHYPCNWNGTKKNGKIVVY